MSRPLHIHTLGSVVENTGASPQTRPKHGMPNSSTSAASC